MSRETLFKLAILASTGAACLTILWAAGLLPSEGPRRLEGASPGAAVAGLPTDAPPPFSSVYAAWPDEATVYRVLPWLTEHERKVWDPIAINRPKPDTRIVLDWPEHPTGAIELVTNERGLRRDVPTPLEKNGERVLVLGDSHTYGLVPNAESFAQVLEDRLAQRRAETSWEVLNAGVSGSGPLEFLGSMLKFLELDPDLVVAVLFVGNDFSNAIPWYEHFQGGSPKLPYEYAKLHTEVGRRFGTPVAQGFGQALRFKARPRDEQAGLETAILCFTEMHRVCASAGIRFLAVVLPTKADVEPDDDPETTAALLDALELTAEDFASARRLGQAFAAELRGRGISVFDLTPSMTATPGPLYWRKDSHLNVAGHAHVAARLEPIVLRLLERERR